MTRRNILAERLHRLAYSYLKKSKKILDIGCGQGELIKLNPQKIIGLEANPATVRFCQKKGYQVKRGSALELPFPKHCFGAVHSGHLIEHFTPPEAYQFLKEVSRVLKPKGILVISSPLLWPGFYNNLTHVKPYPPRAITRYLVENAPDTTFPAIKAKFVVKALHWRYQRLRKTGYMLVLQKIK